MKQVYETAGLDPRETGYVEAHGTGTKVGDPIEATALHNIFGEERTARNPLLVGSIKSNIGHLEAASGKGDQIPFNQNTHHCRHNGGHQDSFDAGTRFRPP